MSASIHIPVEHSRGNSTTSSIIDLRSSGAVSSDESPTVLVPTPSTINGTNKKRKYAEQDKKKRGTKEARHVPFGG